MIRPCLENVCLPTSLAIQDFMTWVDCQLWQSSEVTQETEHISQEHAKESKVEFRDALVCVCHNVGMC